MKKRELCHRGIRQIVPSLIPFYGYNQRLVCENVNLYAPGVEINLSQGE